MLARLREEIAANQGWISFARYMELVLYDPALGYYTGGAPKLGAAGDFVTAPELGSLFGRTLARQLEALGSPILEFGAGSGALAATLLSQRDFDSRILETSPQLKSRQQTRLGSEARWMERLPERIRGVVIANEVVDAMPVHAVAWRAQGSWSAASHFPSISSCGKRSRPQGNCSMKRRPFPYRFPTRARSAWWQAPGCAASPRGWKKA